MLSLQKLLLLVALIGAVWYGFKAFARIQEQRARHAEAEKAAAPKRRSIAAEDLVQCPACRSYVTQAGDNGCARPDCPYAAA